MYHNTPTARTAPLKSTNAPMARQEAEREFIAAHTELTSLGAHASPARLERALARLAAAQRLRALAA